MLILACYINFISFNYWDYSLSSKLYLRPSFTAELPLSLFPVNDSFILCPDNPANDSFNLLLLGHFDFRLVPLLPPKAESILLLSEKLEQSILEPFVLNFLPIFFNLNWLPFLSDAYIKLFSMISLGFVSYRSMLSSLLVSRSENLFGLLGFGL